MASAERFGVEVDGNMLGTVKMTGGTPQRSPVWPALFTAYMSSVVWGAERRLTQGKRELRHKRRKSYWLLSYIDDVNGVRVGSEGEMETALEEAVREAGIDGIERRIGKGAMENT